MDKHNALEAYNMILLCHAGRYLLLRRAGTKRFAPGRWTGLGGRVEEGEFADLHAAAFREVREETGIPAAEIADFTLRRALLQARPGESLTVLLYFTGTLGEPVQPLSSEGTLEWVTEGDLERLDIIENTRLVIPLLIEDVRRDPAGNEPVRVGAAHFRRDGELARIAWT
ncbi:NUDIX domain-containing protein [Nitrolancea hollandica]|uniref:NUDIX hydrolase n=1 Tax=Nitrolancea hollandica Lb TaxID=1129897 RepID=I4EJM4_9BACT|nr:NUDIX domain-containing protein [Nitrolancea hollandica]CCF84886.1 NUDIX hydrolase [Nitrolancea hollandica Lb]